MPKVYRGSGSLAGLIRRPIGGTPKDMATDDDAPAKPEPQRGPVSAQGQAAEKQPEPRESRPDIRESKPELRIEPRPEPREARQEAREPRPEPRDSRPPEPRDPKPDPLTETIRQRLEHLVPELVKKTFSAGMGAVFQTEEGIRRIAREVSLPDVAGYIASSADGAKDKVFEVIARETREFLANLNVTDEIAKLLTTLSFEIKTEIRFIPNSERVLGSEPDVKASVRLKRVDEDKKPETGDAGRDSRPRGRFWRRDGEPDAPDDDDDSPPADK